MLQPLLVDLGPLEGSPLFQPNPQKPPHRAASSFRFKTVGGGLSWALWSPVAWPVDPASGLSLPSLLASAHLWWRGLGTSPRTGRRWPDCHPQEVESQRCAFAGVVAVGAPWPEICTCAHGTALPLTTALSLHSLPACVRLLLRADFLAKCCLFPPLSLVFCCGIGSFQGVEGCGGPRAGWGCRCRHGRGCCMDFFLSLC